ncbi:hypothetical protein [Piscinibacter sp. HJYY11]|uniref:hypothetical protein n=1 Tax=Piscinibacter sp. HJYY11 TaxID=2801333 RepID=UPI00191F38AD|nr:hypothetical protein [Piscinibacter sp. HJYY11]MBL0730728.1 hypothetical protein [Piscinibacter sp. HJYY11]
MTTSLVFALKIALVPSLIGGVTLAGRRWGPGVAGWLSAFPVVAAPILLFLALEQGPGFAAQASAATLSAVIATLVFGASYGWAARRYSWLGSTLFSFACYFVAVLGLNAWAPSLPVSGICVLLALLVAPRLYAHPPHDEPVEAPRSRYEIWWRMLAGALLVVLVTHFASELGPRLSGLLAMFPVVASVLTVFSHIHTGTAFAIRQLRSMVLGYYAFACFCLVLAVSLAHLGIAGAFLAALGVALLVQGASRVHLRQHV